MRILKGDQVKIIAGKDKGKIGNVVKTYPKTDKVLIDGLNIIKKHVKPSQANPDGSIIEKEAPIHVSNVMLIDPKDKKAVTRISYKLENGKKIRIAKKSGVKI
jgi:large subunit ribosomal protein L24